MAEQPWQAACSLPSATTTGTPLEVGVLFAAFEEGVLPPPPPHAASAAASAQTSVRVVTRAVIDVVRWLPIAVSFPASPVRAARSCGPRRRVNR
ncbi:hypothetical protein PSAB6_180056 [Paraburkholderia sabiae]|nr:hypothetical protein PSAB6_180056 [Paraburkholderia sabiae]